MDEPTLRKSRLALAGGLVIALAVGGAGFLVGRGTSPRDIAPVAAVPAPAPSGVAQTGPSRSDTRDDVMTRADLIALAAQAADALASGRALPRAIADAAGQRFDLRLPFGCQGPSAEESDTPMRWRYDSEAGALRVHVAPVVWSGGDLASVPDRMATEKVAEGFWITRPWTASEACPPRPDSAAPIGADAVTLPGQTLAVARFLTADGTHRGQPGGKPYETVIRMAPDEVPVEQGLQLRLRGRIAGATDRAPVSCRQPAGAEQRPICIVAITVEDVAIDDPRTARTLATWNVATPGNGNR